VSKPTKANGADAQAIKTFMAALSPFRRIRPTMPLQYVIAFLLVAEEEGLSVSEYAERAGVSLSVMSRHLLDIGPRNRYMEEGFGLVETRQNPMELRKNELYLSHKGRALMNEISRQLRN
jgi:DNA-binding MarR family transcriptional regulator